VLLGLFMPQYYMTGHFQQEMIEVCCCKLPCSNPGK
jgi:hypothetical protein